MSERDTAIQPTQHAFLVAWGRFAAEMGLIEAIQGVKLKQKKYRHAPQAKVLEFLVAMLAGLPHLQDISRSAHPLDQDQMVAEAWGQPTWADYSGCWPGRRIELFGEAELCLPRHWSRCWARNCATQLTVTGSGPPSASRIFAYPPGLKMPGLKAR